MSNSDQNKNIHKEGLKPGFNVRNYGIAVENGAVLLCEEWHGETFLRKFPGGGLEFAEAPAEGLKREFREEADLDVEVDELFYVSPNFHRSYFSPVQLIALFWKVRGAADFQSFPEKRLIPESEDGHFYRLYWHQLDQLSINDMSKPIDREVVEKLLSSQSGAGR